MPKRDYDSTTMCLFKHRRCATPEAAMQHSLSSSLYVVAEVRAWRSGLTGSCRTSTSRSLYCSGRFHFMLACMLSGTTPNLEVFVIKAPTHIWFTKRMCTKQENLCQENPMKTSEWGSSIHPCPIYSHPAPIKNHETSSSNQI